VTKEQNERKKANLQKKDRASPCKGTTKKEEGSEKKQTGQTLGHRGMEPEVD